MFRDPKESQYMASTAGTKGHMVEGGGWGLWPGAAPGAGTLQAWSTRGRILNEKAAGSLLGPALLLTYWRL